MRSAEEQPMGILPNALSVKKYLEGKVGCPFAPFRKYDTIHKDLGIFLNQN